MKATFLGTGCAMVLKRYNTCFLLEQDDNKLLVDAGGGNEVLVRLDKLGVPVTAIGGMFVTPRLSAGHLPPGEGVFTFLCSAGNPRTVSGSSGTRHPGTFPCRGRRRAWPPGGR